MFYGSQIGIFKPPQASYTLGGGHNGLSELLQASYTVSTALRTSAGLLHAFL